jgi:hypothetical protein
VNASVYFCKIDLAKLRLQSKAKGRFVTFVRDKKEAAAGFQAAALAQGGLRGFASIGITNVGERSPDS